MKCIIGTGSRDWKDPYIIKKVFIDLIEEYGIFKYRHGACRGFDTLSDIIARELKITDIIKYPAKWKEYGNAAGMIRNRLMLDTELEKENRVDLLVIGFPLLTSVGTHGMMNYAKEKGVETRYYDIVERRLK